MLIEVEDADGNGDEVCFRDPIEYGASFNLLDIWPVALISPPHYLMTPVASFPISPICSPIALSTSPRTVQHFVFFGLHFLERLPNIELRHS